MTNANETFRVGQTVTVGARFNGESAGKNFEATATVSKVTEKTVTVGALAYRKTKQGWTRGAYFVRP